MELWIRSQDRERLGKIVYLELKNDDYGFYIIGWRDKFEGTRMATYKTKERALEVLDEIQRLIEDLHYMSYAIPNDKFTGYKPNVYKMPLE